MHYHLEIIMPPTDDVEKAVKEILAPFDENGVDEEGDPNCHTFWDFYIIGGRWAGEKERQSSNPDVLKAFYEQLKEMKVTVSGLTCGKEALAPASQIPAVDAAWVKHFPDGGKVCPLFSHYNDQYKHSAGYPDIMTLKEIPKNLNAGHVIIAAPNYKDEIAANYMVEESVYNGVNYLDIKWDGTIRDALIMNIDKMKNYKEEAREKYTPTNEWLVVTVDYHS